MPSASGLPNFADAGRKPGDRRRSGKDSMTAAYRRESLADLIRFARQRISAFKNVLDTRETRETALDLEIAAIEKRRAALRRDCEEAPAAITRAERELRELTAVESANLATKGYGYSGSGNKVAAMVDRRKKLLARIAELQAELTEQLEEGGAQ